jgi:hypothetical protein
MCRHRIGRHAAVARSATTSSSGISPPDSHWALMTPTDTLPTPQREVGSPSPVLPPSRGDNRGKSLAQITGRLLSCHFRLLNAFRLRWRPSPGAFMMDLWGLIEQLRTAYSQRRPATACCNDGSVEGEFGFPTPTPSPPGACPRHHATTPRPSWFPRRNSPMEPEAWSCMESPAGPTRRPRRRFAPSLVWLSLSRSMGWHMRESRWQTTLAVFREFPSAPSIGAEVLARVAAGRQTQGMV